METPVTPPHLHATKDDTFNRTVNVNGLQSNNVTQVNLSLVLSSQNASSIGHIGQMTERKTTSNGSASSSFGQQGFATKEIATNTPKSTQCRVDPQPAGSTPTAIHNKEVSSSSTFNIEVKCVIRSDYAMHNCDYDSTETFQSDPSATSPIEDVSSVSYSRNILLNNHDARKYDQTRPEGTETFYSQRSFPLSITQNPIECGVQDKTEVQSSEVKSTTHGALRDQFLPQNVVSSSAKIQCHEVTISKQSREHLSPEHTTSDISREASTTTEAPESPMSSSDVTSPVSPVSMWSTSGGDFSPGIVSTHSEDVFSELTTDQLPSPAQKSSSYCASKLSHAHIK
ncbi:unnamed protein product, partial [Candidula unifasciata]